jgi:hypothetical protein
MIETLMTVIAYWLSLVAQAFTNLFDVRYW